MNQLSDHHPYFLLLNLNLKKQNALHQVKITNYSQTTVENFCNDIHDSCLTDLNSSLQQDPNINCNVLESVISEAREKNMAINYVKFKKYQHKKSQWIING